MDLFFSKDIYSLNNYSQIEKEFSSHFEIVLKENELYFILTLIGKNNLEIEQNKIDDLNNFILGLSY